VTKPSRLDDPEYSKFAWQRYWRLMRWMAAFTILLTAAVLGAFFMKYGMVSVHLYIATGGAIVAAILLTAGLMGLIFLSSGSGHDDAIEDPFKGEADK
jgi:hypothetical protein